MAPIRWRAAAKTVLAVALAYLLTFLVAAAFVGGT